MVVGVVMTVFGGWRGSWEHVSCHDGDVRVYDGCWLLGLEARCTDWPCWVVAHYTLYIIHYK